MFKSLVDLLHLFEDNQQLNLIGQPEEIRSTCWVPVQRSVLVPEASLSLTGQVEPWGNCLWFTILGQKRCPELPSEKSSSISSSIMSSRLDDFLKETRLLVSFLNHKLLLSVSDGYPTINAATTENQRRRKGNFLHQPIHFITMDKEVLQLVFFFVFFYKISKRLYMQSILSSIISTHD